ncbi:MAG: AsmA-like C-terminal domain-containing protein [Rhodospirillales bacterium]
MAENNDQIDQPDNIDRPGLFRRWCRGLAHLAGGLVAGVAIVAGLLSWQLSKGPISLSFLTPYIEQALNERSPELQVDLGDTILTWAGWERALDIRVLDVLVYDKLGAVVAAIPEVSFSLSSHALIRRGAIVPKSVELFGPRLVMRRSADGRFEVNLGGTSSGGTPSEGRQLGSGLLDLLVAKVGAGPGQGAQLAYLSRLNIIGAETVIVDEVLGRRWSAPIADIRLVRDDVGIQGEVSLQMDLEGRRSEVTAKGSYLVNQQRLAVSVAFSDLDPKAFAGFHESLKPFDRIQLPLRGTVTLGMKVNGPPEDIGFLFTGGEGVILTPDPYEEAIAVKSLVLKGRYDGRARTAEIFDFSVEAKEGATVRSPGSAQHRIPVTAMKFAGKYWMDEDRAVISRLNLETGGPRVAVNGTVNDVTGNPVSALDVTLRDTPLKNLKQYWAPEWAPDVYDWWIENITDGFVPRLDMKVRAAGNAGGWTINSIVGDMDFHQGVLTYLKGMPAITDMEGKANFTHKRFDVFLSRGNSGGMALEEGQLFITGLSTHQEVAEIQATVAGPLDKALALIDHAPLGYATEMGVKPSGAKGTARVHLRLALPLILDLELDHVKVAADARLRDAAIPNALHGFDLEHADLNLSVDKRGMEVKGDGVVAGMPADISWRENFGDRVAFRTILDLSGRIPDVARLRELGLNVGLLSDEYVSGAVGANLRFTVLNDQETRVEVRADLAEAELAVDRVKWRKPLGAAGRAEMNLTFKGNKPSEITHFALYAEDLAVAGRGTFEEDGTAPRRIDFTRINYGRTNMQGALIRRADGAWDLGFHGASLDLMPVWKDLTDGRDDTVLGDFVLAAEFQKVWIGENQLLTDVSGTFQREDEVWRTVFLKTMMDGSTTVDVELKPGPDGGNRTVEINTADAGTVLRTIGLYDNMQGGVMKLSGTFDDSHPDRPLKGRLMINDYRVLKAPALAHLVSIMALTGILDALQGDGLGFAVLDIPFTMRSGVVEISDARAAGTSLGFTASGTVYTHADVLDIQGTVVPAYAINSALGRIPVLGNIFTGGEKGSGLFAANFRMTGPQEDPKVDVNPLSALAPGFLRRLFGVFEDAPRQPPADPSSPPTTK